MALVQRSELNKVALLIFGLAMFFNGAQARLHLGIVQRSSSTIFDVTKFGAKGNGKLSIDQDGDPNNNAAFIQAWRATCDSNGPAKMVIPPGNFVTSQVVFGGPCRNPNPIIELQGTVVASKDVSTYYSPDWFLIENVNGLSIIGSGTFEGQGKINWQDTDCKNNLPNCSLKIHGAAKSAANSIEAIRAINSRFFKV
ncbi:hypothetical protein Dimus_016206 [Dionaea muscipula]